jgi:hypothetical protein
MRIGRSGRRALAMRGSLLCRDHGAARVSCQPHRPPLVTRNLGWPVVGATCTGASPSAKTFASDPSRQERPASVAPGCTANN